MLKSLELFGFKSFADRTIFDFAPGITGVVGPNGSGKSNVVDSIKWILGDQSAKSLRGKEMTDVIFNGSSGRTGSQFAEATLVFDNRSRFLPLEMDEVSVGRRLWQSGDSEYLVNRNTARLKDVRELFVGTGAGAATYCIIEQGRVDQILQSNAANRRLIFEEAAGISRFKSKRTEALKRLERVEQNLTRLSDLVSEVETQVQSIRTQAQRATKYQAVSQELEQLWVGLAADDYRCESLVRNELKSQLDGVSLLRDRQREQQTAAAADVADADAALAIADDKLRAAEQQRGELRSRLASLEATIRHQQSREGELQSDVQRLIRQQTLMTGRVTEAEAEQQHVATILTQERDAFERRRSTVLSGDDQVHALQAQVHEARRLLDAARQDLMTQVRGNSEASALCQTLLTRQREVATRIEHLTARHLQLSGELQSVSDQLPLLESECRAARGSLETTEHAADALLLNRDALVSARSQSQQSLAELREQRSAQVARRAVLEDLEDRQEGFGIGVREILRRAEESNAEPWNLICGSVADLLDVDLEHAALLEVALSGRAQLLVVTKQQPLISYLTSGRCRITDRVGFVSIEQTDAAIHDLAELRRTLQKDAGGWREEQSTISVGHDTPAQVTWFDPRNDSSIVRSVFSRTDAVPPSLFGQRGVVGRADGIARPPQSMPTLASHLLADTWIVETLADALRLQSATQGTCRFVTLQGELVENDGTLFAGTVRNETALLSRKSELRRLRNELHRLEHEIAERELRLRNVSEDLSSTDDRLRSARTAVAAAVETCRTAAAKSIECQRESGAIERQLRDVVVQQQREQDEASRLDDELAAARTSEEAGEAELQQRQLSIVELTDSQAERQRELETLERDRTAASLEVTRSEERLLGLQEAAERVQEDLQQRQLQLQEAERRLAAALERQRDLALARLNCVAEMSELAVGDEHLSFEIRTASEARHRLKMNRATVMSNEATIREQLRSHESRQHELELRISTIDHQLSSAAQRIRDEFQLEVVTAVAMGRSAIAIWQMRGEETVDAEHGESADNLAERTSGAAFDDRAQEILADPERRSEIRTAIEQRIEQLRRQLRKMGAVGTESLDHLLEFETRYTRLKTQLTDLEAARDSLRDIVRRIDVESRRLFVESFEMIRGFFRELFRKLFGGGEADLILEDPEDVLECAIEVVARPPGKELRSISLLSGGEKTLTAVALLLSIFKSRNSPFCLLDEVDAALDDANIGRFVNVLREFQQNTQFIMITHRKPTMAVTDVLYGVTMEESGISRRLSLRFEDVDERGNFNPGPSRLARAA